MVCGTDGQAVEIHAFKLLTYSPSLADILSPVGLAGSAIGAAAARLLLYDGVNGAEENNNNNNNNNNDNI